MTFFQIIIFSIVQGIAELFPISSVAHGVLVPYVFGWSLSPEFLKHHFLAFVVMLHLGTSLAMFIYFWKDWMQIIRQLFGEDRRILMRLIAATVPAGVIGVIFEQQISALFGDPFSASLFLVVNGFFLYFGEKISTRGHKRIEELTIRQAFTVGLFQALALIPGFSRSGSSMTAGFWVGLQKEQAARFSMLMATPIIAGASLLELPKVVDSSHHLLENALLGGTLSGIIAFLSLFLLMRWFKQEKKQTMRPFAYYCWAVGGLILITFFI